MRNFWYISFYWVLFLACSSGIYPKTVSEIAPNAGGTGLMDGFQLRKFEAHYMFKELDMSGILLCKRLNDSTLSGSFLNEFGIKGFDFTIRGNQVHLNYVVKQLNRWYIRKMLKSDMHFLFGIPLKVKPFVNGKDSCCFYRVSPTITYCYYVSGKSDQRAGLYHGKKEIVKINRLENQGEVKCYELIHLDNPLKLSLKELK